MQFVNPGFLWALFLLAIPVIVHLFNFRRYKKVAFSNVSMLKEVKAESQRTRQLKKWLVLCARMLALGALIMAFAQPYIPLGNSEQVQDLKAIYIDNSFSMYAEGEQGQLFEEAKNLARDLLSSFDQNESIVLFSNYKNSNVLSKEEAIDFIDQLEVSAQANDLMGSVQKMDLRRQQLGYSNSSMYLFTDLQNTRPLSEAKIDSSNSVDVISLDPKGLQNLSIDSLWLDAPIHRLNEIAKLNILVSNHGDQPSESNSIKLSVNGEHKGAELFDVGAKDKVIVKLELPISSGGDQLCHLQLDDPEVFFDNSYYFVLNVKEVYRVLELGNENSPFKRITTNDEQFEHKVSDPLQLDLTWLEQSDLLILNGIGEVSSGLQAEIKSFVENGGVLLLYPGEEVAGLNDFCTRMGLATYGIEVQKDLSIDASVLNSKLFAGVYSSVPEHTALPKIDRCFELQTPVNSNTILSLRDGTAILSTGAMGKGKWFQFSIPLSKEWSNFSDHELFVLSTLQIAYSKLNQNQPAYQLGHRHGIPMELGDEGSFELSNEEQAVIVQTGSAGGGHKFWLNEQINSAGFYHLRQKEGTETIMSLGLNYNRLESVQKYYSKQELIDGFGEAVSLSESSANQQIASIIDGDQARKLWKLFLIFSLICLLIEILLLRFIKS